MSPPRFILNLTSWWIPSTLLVSGVVLSLGIGMAVYKQQEQDIQLQTEATLNVIAHQLATDANTRLLALARMGTRLALSADRTEWEADARNYRDHFPALAALAMTAADGSPPWVIPREATKLENVAPTGSSVIRTALDNGISGTSSLFYEDNDHKYILIHTAFPESSTLKALTALIDAEHFLKDSMHAMLASDHPFAIYHDSTELFRRGSPKDLENEWVREAAMDSLGTPLRIVAGPPERILERGALPVPLGASALGILISLMFAGSLRLAQHAAEGRRLADAHAVQHERARDLFRNVLTAAPDAMIIVDQNGHIQMFNEQAERTFGYSRETLLQRPVEDLVPHGLRSHDITTRAEYLQSYSVAPIGAEREQVAIHQDGSLFPVEISLSPLDTVDGLIIIAAIRDIRDRRAIENELEGYRTELERSNAELQQFAYVASHDLQEPLRMVSSFTQLLAQRYKGRLDEDADEFIAYAVDGASRMKILINDLLTYSKLGSKDLDLQHVPSEEVIAHAQANLKYVIETTGATLTHDELPTVLADRNQLQQLFQNLLSNALKFHGDAPPRIHIGARRDAGQWVFSVTDHGIGIEPRYFGRLFIIFQRLHGPGQYTGTGIGLALCQKIVERHRGRIWVESDPAVGGSTFYFTLPEAEEIRE